MGVLRRNFKVLMCGLETSQTWTPLQRLHLLSLLMLLCRAWLAALVER